MNVKKFFLFCTVLILTFSFNSITAQQKQKTADFTPALTKFTNCGTDDYHLQKMETDAEYAARHQQINELLYEAAILKQKTQASGDSYLKGPSTACQPDEPVLHVPIVIHVVHDPGTPLGQAENPTDAEIISVIDEVNNRLAHTSGMTFSNPYSGINTNIQLCFAERDPAGNPTSGIVRYADAVNTIHDRTTDNTQATYHWPTNQYFNFYLVKTICDGTDCPNWNGVYGYATFPGSHGAFWDGAVFLGESFWYGLTCHEIGHYFSLYHTFQDGCPNCDCRQEGDQICDTPPKGYAGAASGCGASNSCITDQNDPGLHNPFRPVVAGGLGDVDDSSENYLDISGSCWNAFTQGQKDRMRAAILTSRGSLLTSPACTPFTASDAGITQFIYPVDLVCEADFQPTVELTNFGTSTLTTVDILIELDGSLSATYTWAGSIAPGNAQNVTIPTTLTANLGNQTLYAFTQTPNGVTDGYDLNNDACIEFQMNMPIDNLQHCEDLENAQLPAGWTAVNTDDFVTFEPYMLNTCTDNDDYVLGYISFQQWTSATGTTDGYISPVLDLTNYSDASLTFDLAYAMTYTNRTTILDISVSDNCGENYTSLYNKTNWDLDTTGEFVTTPWEPADCGDWRTETINLNAYAGSSVLVKFEIIIPEWYGQNLFLDNICVDGTFVPPAVADAEIKVLLEGAYDNTLQEMTTELSNGGLLPNEQPYDRPIWNYQGGEMVASPGVFPANVVDWILVEARDVNDKNVVLDTRAALVQKDGTVIETDGSTGVLFTNLTAGQDCYLVVRHRNHLDIISSNIVTLPNAVAYDMTIPANVEDGMNQLADLGNGSYGMLAGDFNGDGVVTITDFNLYNTQASLINVYVDGDANLDKTVTVGDFNLYQPNSSKIGVSEIRF